jgi:nucleoside-diphosphate-sugar epimerase
MRLLIIGCGYLGRRVARSAAAAGHMVHAMTRSAAHADEFRSQGWEPVIADVLKPESLAELPQVDVVVHAVGLDRRSGASMQDVYVGGMANVVRFLSKPGRFLYVSSSSVYGQTDGSWVDESSPTEPQEDSGRIVLETEQTLRSALPDAIVLRFSGIYGPGRLLRRQTIESGEPIVGDAEKWLNLIHVEDGAAAVLRAFEAPLGSTFNICDDEPVKRRDFYRELARCLGKPEPTFLPPPPGQPTPPHEKGNRRIRNEAMRRSFGIELAYPNFRVGLAASCQG